MDAVGAVVLGSVGAGAGASVFGGTVDADVVGGTEAGLDSDMGVLELVVSRFRSPLDESLVQLASAVSTTRPTRTGRDTFNFATSRMTMRSAECSDVPGLETSLRTATDDCRGSPCAADRARRETAVTGTRVQCVEIVVERRIRRVERRPRLRRQR